jgi:hypothetical protein
MFEDVAVEVLWEWLLVGGIVLVAAVEVEILLAFRDAEALLGFRWRRVEDPLPAESVGVLAPLRIVALLLSELKGGLVVIDRGGGRIEAPKLPVPFCATLLVLVWPVGAAKLGGLTGNLLGD